jgi:valyl-tRNA synthetase
LQEVLATINDHFGKFRISDALMSVYRLIWEDFCSWYLEMIKPPYQAPIDSWTLDKSISIFEKLMKILHPFMPFLTEEVWNILKERKSGDSIVIAQMPVSEDYDKKMLERFAFAKETVIAVRNIRNNKNIPNKQALQLMIRGDKSETVNDFQPVVEKLANLENLEFVEHPKEDAVQVLVRSTEMFIPLEGAVDKDEEIEKLQNDLEYYKGFLKGVSKKLSNDKFVKNAPSSVVQKERKKKADTEEKIKILESQLEKLK